MSCGLIKSMRIFKNQYNHNNTDDNAYISKEIKDKTKKVKKKNIVKKSATLKAVFLGKK